MELEVDRIRCFIKLLHMVAARPQMMADIRQCTAANMEECADAVSAIRDSKVSRVCATLFFQLEFSMQHLISPRLFHACIAAST